MNEELNKRLSDIEKTLDFILEGMQKMSKVILNINACMDFVMEEKKANES